MQKHVHLAEKLGSDQLFIGPSSAQATEVHFRWPELLAVTDLDATKRVLKDNGVDFQVSGVVLLIPPAASHGLALEFVEQETI